MALVIPLLFFVLVWALFILPQQRRVRAHQALVATLSVGQEVVTTAGLFGVITALDPDEVRLEVAPGVELRFARAAVARIAPSSPAQPPPAPSPRSGRTVADPESDAGGSVPPPPQGSGPVIRRRRGIVPRPPGGSDA